MDNKLDMIREESEYESKKLDKLIDFEIRKNVHINLSKPVHAEFKKKLFDYNLYMSETFAHFAQLVIEENVWAMKIVKEAYKLKRQDATKVTKKEAENLYDAISEVDPFSS